MQQLITEQLADVLSLRPAGSGLHLYADWRRSEQQFEQFLQACDEISVYVVDARKYGLYVTAPAVCLGYAHMSEEDIKAGISRLQSAWAMVKANRTCIPHPHTTMKTTMKPII